MLPSVYPGSLVLADPFLEQTQLSTGDIVILEHNKKLLLKRLIAQNGDLLSLRHGAWSLNGHEPEICKTKEYSDEGVSWHVYCQPETGSKTLYKKIKVNHYFLMGDNRAISVDSRHFGEIPKINLKSKVVYIWEPHHWFSGIMYFLKALYF